MRKMRFAKEIVFFHKIKPRGICVVFMNLCEMLSICTSDFYTFSVEITFTS